MALDLLIKNGTIYCEGGWVGGNLLVENGKIAGIVNSDEPAAEQVIDATGKFVVPGLVDAHIHLRDPGYTHKEDYATGTMAAAAGGVTTVLDQPNTNPVPTTLALYQNHVRSAQSKAYVDFNSIASPSQLDEIGKLSDFGAAGFKIFQKSAAYPYDTEASIPESDRIFRCFAEVAKTGKPCAVHPHNNEYFNSLVRQAKEEGRLDAKCFCELTGNEVVYSSTVPQLLYFQQKTGVLYYALHCMFPDYIELIREAKRKGARVISDILYPMLVPPDMKKFDLLKNHLTVWVTEKTKKACWDALADGTIDFIDTDHAPHTREEILRGAENPEAMALGLPGVEHFLSLLLTEVNNGRLTLGQLVRLVSVNPARAFALYPQKGSLQPGSDADIVVIDMNRGAMIDGRNLYTRCGWTPYEGREVQGVPTHTVCRGKIISEHGRVVGERGYGRFVPVAKRS
jgi:dihydroorotase (multifunctional complex type)